MSHGGTPVSNGSSGSSTQEHGAPVGASLHSMVRKGRSFSGHERNCCFLNLDGSEFADISAVSGFDFPDDGRAVALSDWDFDGDLDMWVANRSGPQVRLLCNELATDHHFLSIKLEGKTCNRDAIGARVEVTLTDSKGDSKKTKLIKTLRAGEGFLAQSSKWLHFGLGMSAEIEKLVVHWPGGEKEQFSGLEVDRHVLLIQNSGAAQKWIPPKRESKLEPAELQETKSTDQARVVSAAMMPIPALDYKTFDDKQHWIGQTKLNRPTLINLWASWCRPCLKELKEFSERQEDIEQAGLDVIALSVDLLDPKQKVSAEAARKLLENVGFDGIAGWASAATAEKLQLLQDHLFDLHQTMAVPTSLLIDANGQLAVLYRGPVSVDQLLADVSKLPELTKSDAALPFAGRWHTRRTRLSPHDYAWQLVEHGYLEETIAYIANNRKLLESHFNIPKLLVLVGNSLLARGNAKGAILYYRDALSIDRTYGEAQNNLAWVLSTHPDKNIRGGKEAVELVLSALKRRSGDISSLLDTLAAAYAEVEQFEQAVKVARKAIEVATSGGQHQDYIERIEKRLKLYEAGKPYRDQ